MTDIVRIPLNGGEIQAVDIDGKPFAIFRPIVESIGLDYSSQIAKLKTRSWVNRRDIPTVAADGKTRLMVAIDVPSLLMWLATVNEAKVAEAVRPLLVAYQRESSDAIHGYWTKGGAINPNATEDQLAAIITRAKGQADVLAALRGIVAPSWLEAKARHVAARALGEEPELDPMARPLTVGEFLEDKGLTAAERRSVSSKLGGRIKGLFIGEHGRMPDKVDRFIDGALRPVYAYTEKDRPLFELAWAALSASTRAGR